MSDDRHKKALDQAVQKLRTQFSNYVTAIYCYGAMPEENRNSGQMWMFWLRYRMILLPEL